MKILIKDALIINEYNQFTGSVLIEDSIIKKIYLQTLAEDIKADKIIEAKGKFLIPGVIDDQVHFREPGLTHKAEIYTESKAAVAGGVTSYMEMPNTIPQTINQDRLQEKFNLASKKSLANFSFYIGATNDNLSELLKTDPTKVCGIKVFMGSSTGNMLVDNKEALENIFAQAPTLVAVHCEDEKTIQANLKKYKIKYGDVIPFACHPLIRSTDACFKSSSLAVNLAKKHGTRLHILHLSTAKEMDLFSAEANLSKKQITAEVCVHHLWFDDNSYKDKGSKIKWNPAIKSKKDKDALWEALLGDKLDVIATDHAPHTIEEKTNEYLKAPAGGPLVQHSLQIMLEFNKKGKISLKKIVDKMCHKPAELFKIKKRGFIREGYYADLVLIDNNTEYKVNKTNIYYKCGWSPFEGEIFHSKVVKTFVNGNLVYDSGIFNEETKGVALEFDR